MTVHAKTCGKNHVACECGKFKMPFGRFKGRTIESIFYDEDGGERYLKWAAAELDPCPTRDFVESFLVMKGVA